MPVRAVHRKNLGRGMIRSFFAKSRIVRRPDSRGKPHARLLIHHRIMLIRLAIPDHENGKQVVKVVNPELIAVMKRFGLDPNKLDAATEQAFEQNAEMKAALQKVMGRLMNQTPTISPNHSRCRAMTVRFVSPYRNRGSRLRTAKTWT